MTDRDRLIELFNAIEKDPAVTCPHYKTDKTCDTCKYTINNFMCNHTERTVDYLLANGVIVPPCKVGDTVYKIIYFRCEKPEKCEMTHCAVKTSKKYDFTTVKTMCLKIIPTPFKLEYLTKLGTNVFLTKEEAEQALVTDTNVGGKKERGGNEKNT